jgi:hypothetical protein
LTLLDLVRPQEGLLFGEITERRYTMNWKFLRRLSVGIATIAIGVVLVVLGVQMIRFPLITGGSLFVVLGFWYMVDTERPTW